MVEISILRLSITKLCMGVLAIGGFAVLLPTYLRPDHLDELQCTAEESRVGDQDLV